MKHAQVVVVGMYQALAGNWWEMGLVLSVAN